MEALIDCNEEIFPTVHRLLLILIGIINLRIYSKWNLYTNK
jgi:hypothetical protein